MSSAIASSAVATAPANKWMIAAAEDSAIKLLDLTVNRHAAVMAYNDVFWLMGMLFILSIPLLIMLGNGSSKSSA